VTRQNAKLEIGPHHFRPPVVSDDPRRTSPRRVISDVTLRPLTRHNAL
jgi:hypothetical protein